EHRSRLETKPPRRRSQSTHASGRRTARQRRQLPETDLAAFRCSPRVVAGLMDRLRLIARIFGRVVIPPFGALRRARQPKADDLLDLLVAQDEVVPRFPEQVLVERLVLVLVSFVFLLCHACVSP